MASVGGSDADDYVMLRTHQLELLALTLRNREERMIYTKSFDTEKDRVEYLKSVNSAFEQTMDLLRANTGLRQRCSEMEDLTKRSRASSIVDDIHWSVETAVDLSLQGFRNGALRSHFLSKLRRHLNIFENKLKSPDFAVGEEGMKLMEEAKSAKDSLKMCVSKYRSPFARASTEAYRAMIKQKGDTVAEIIKRRQIELELEGEFESLEETDQIKVYKGILEDAFEESFPFFEKAAMGAGTAVILITVGMMAYDVITADNHAEAALKASLDTVAMIAGFFVQVVVDVGATEILTAIGLGAIAVPLGALVLSMAVGYVFSVGAGQLIDEIIGRGGKAPNLEGLTFHKITAPPDGREIASEIARGGY